MSFKSYYGFTDESAQEVLKKLQYFSTKDIIDLHLIFDICPDEIGLKCSEKHTEYCGHIRTCANCWADAIKDIK